LNIQAFLFRGLHPQVWVGTASDRYAGWLGQIYSLERYASRLSRRTKLLGNHSLTEELVPIESVREYFQHFRVLELDFTFYRPLLDEQKSPTQNYRTLRKYAQYLEEGDSLILKVPQAVCAQRIMRAGTFLENPTYLDPDVFTLQFYEPAVDLLGPRLRAFVFEQEYQRKQDRSPAERFAEQLDRFFRSIPSDHRYHLELRTEAYLAPCVFEVMGTYGIGQVLSHWTWLPPLSVQFDRSGRVLRNADKQCIVRLLTPRGVRYEDAYLKAHPFDKILDDMLDRRMIEETADLIQKVIDLQGSVNVIVNNRAGGNAPAIAQQIARRFLERTRGQGAAGGCS